MMYLELLAGLAILIVGGELLVRGAVGIAKKFKISTLVIGMTVISFGTSAPELIVSVKAALENHPEIAVGNVIGSNIANIALVLGITVLIFPIVVDRNSKIIDWPMMMGASLLFYLFSLDNAIVFWEGLVLVGILITFTVLLIRNSRKKEQLEPDEVEMKIKPLWVSLVHLALGLTSLFFGAKFLLDGAVAVAASFGMSEKVIAVTIVAFGTSVPELVTSAVAAFRKETGISVGNLIGSNIFNIMAVIGITALIHPIEVNDETLNFDMFWVLGIALLLLPLMIFGRKLNRFKGALLLASYVAYIVILVIAIG